jgi:hypothetical protein
MTTICNECQDTYDDARRSTICPHEKLMPDEDMDRKIAAIKLIGKRLRWANEPDGALQVESVSYNGMVTIRGWAGEFAPHLFVIVEGGE